MASNWLRLNPPQPMPEMETKARIFDKMTHQPDRDRISGIEWIMVFPRTCLLFR